jgi:nucleoside-diphosphate-sugar epimerase
MKRVLLVGGAGFIGHHIALELQNRGHEVQVVDSFQVNNLGSIVERLDENVKLYTDFIHGRLNLLRESGVGIAALDARDYGSLSKVVSSFVPDVVVHLAAVAHANKSNKDPKSTFDHSLRTLENSLDASRKARPHFIYFSSSMVYGNFEGDQVTEDDICNPIGIYGSLKLAGELMVKSYGHVFDIPYTIVRPSALYGERCVSRRVGQAFIENALRGRDLSVNGDGTDKLDFTYVSDVVGGVMAMIGSDKSYKETFNLTFGEGRSILDLAQLVLARFPGVTLVHNERDQLMPERGTLSNEKIRSLLGYRSSYPIEVGFNSYIDWYKSVWVQAEQTG